MANGNNGLKKEIGIFDGISIIGGIMLGSSIFYLGSYVLIRTDMNFGLAILAWIAGGLISLLCGLCYAELGASDPRAGGITVYLSTAYSPIVGFLYGFNLFLLAGPGSIAAVALVLASVIQQIVPFGDFGMKSVAVLSILGLSIVNYRGAELGTLVQNLSMIGKIIPIILILVVGLIKGGNVPDLSIPFGTAGYDLGSIINMVAVAVVVTLWAYEGWANLNSLAEEMKNPKRTLPAAIIISIGSITLLYVLFNYSILRVLSYEEIHTMLQAGDFYLGTAAAMKTMGNFGGRLVSLTMIVALLGSLNGCILAFPRNYYAMSMEGHFFASFKKLHPKYAVPHYAIMAQAGISVVLVFIQELPQLIALVVFSSMLFNILTTFAVLRYRKKFPELERPYKVKGYPFTVVMITALFVGLTVNTLREDPVTSLIGVCVPLLGVGFYYYFDRRKN
ncbi:amino acid/polyamine transporter i [Trichococcus palustris]|uniref:Amino acid/polyamine transporter i n=1 Tax=Trichococcus palustris TaxID=140314 RepID=A0A143YPL0_9LACT|nr:amino acid permease [Trichococcus palustris]CZQ95324.1 amino acid/polyamine transporter i [Trichococcus palustris]SFK96315.1 basic amino acid/polyamine antiporter, APA family [Trichococcus palustris]